MERVPQTRAEQFPATADASWVATSPARQRAVLEARARRLAERPEASEGGAEQVLLLVQFRLGEETFGLDCGAVREVILADGITALPRTPPFVLGVLNVRGQILSVVDLRRLLSLPAAALTGAARVLVLTGGGLEFGLVVDALGAMRSLPVSLLGPPPQNVAGTGARYLRGVTADGLSVLDAAAILADPSLIVNEPDRRVARSRAGEVL